MALSLHSLHRPGSAERHPGSAERHPGSAERHPAQPAAPMPTATASGQGTRSLGARVTAVQRVGAVLVAVVLLGFGVLGFLNGLAYFSTEGDHIAGLSSNGLLSTISVVTAALLIAAAVRGARVVSTVMLVLGVAFLVSALANLAVLRSSANILAFSMSNVVFSLVAGLLLLVLGAYGRVSGNLPEDSPYAHTVAGDAAADLGPEPEEYATTPAERAAERDMREAEIAVLEHRATPDQAARVAAMARVRTRADRRRVWLEHDRTSAG